MLISARFVKKHGHHRQFLFLIGWVLKKSSPLKPLGQMNRNLVGSIFGRSSIKLLILAGFISKHSRHRQYLFSDWLISKKSSLKLGSQMNSNLVGRRLWKVLYKVSSKQNERWATQAQPTEPLVKQLLTCK